MIEVSQKDIETINQSFPIFINSYLYFLVTANSKYGTYFTLTHLRVVDGNGEVILDYVDNLEGGPTRFIITKPGLYTEWFPHPPYDTPTPAPMMRIQKPQDGYPVGTSTPTAPSYP